MAVDLDSYRERADRFLSELTDVYYRHFAGLEEALDLEPVYERFADLATVEACETLREAAAGAPPRSAPVELWRFACEGHLGSVTRAQEERLAALEVSLAATVDGETIGFRMLRPALANEPDRARRERLERARAELAAELLPVYVEAAGEVRAAARALGGGSVRDLYERFGFALEPLATRCRAVLDATEDLYVAAFDRLLRDRAGVTLGEARRFDVPRVFRAVAWDDAFPAGGMLPALEGTLAGLGIDLRSQPNVELDLEERPTKSPRAFCAPIEVPGRVALVIQPIGGLDDWRALFHEAGHTEHFAHTSARLPLEPRRLGDNAVTESYAFLLEHLVIDPAWLERRLDVGRGGELASESAARHLYALRRYCAKLLYELELHAGDEVETMADRYVELLSGATKIEPAGVDFLADVDPGFYVTSYLRAWALEAQLARHLRERFGTAWFADRRAGSLLRELWSEGQGLDADAVAREVTGALLELDASVERARELIRT